MGDIEFCAATTECHTFISHISGCWDMKVLASGEEYFTVSQEDRGCCIVKDHEREGKRGRQREEKRGQTFFLYN